MIQRNHLRYIKPGVGMTSEYERIHAQIVGGGMDVFRELDVRCTVYLLNILGGLPVISLRL